MAHGGTDKYYNPDNKIVNNGDVAYADDLNSINYSADAAFEQVAEDMDALELLTTTVVGDAQGWASDPQGTLPDPLILDTYSSKAYAQEAREAAYNTNSTIHKADGTVVTGAAGTSAYSSYVGAQNYANAADASADTASAMATIAVTQGGIATTKAGEAAASALAADASADAAAISEFNADASADAAAASAAVFTAANILTELKTVDGAASGLNADLLDGVQGASYALLASPTFTGTLTAANGTFTGTLTASTVSGSISIGTSQTTGTITIGGTSQTGQMVIGRSTASQSVNLAVGATASGSTKTLNLGINGAAGSTTQVNIGSGVSATTTTLHGTVSTSQPPATDDNTTRVATTAHVNSVIASRVSGFKNRIINGNMTLWQRSTAQTTSGYGSADRWLIEASGSTFSSGRELLPVSAPVNTTRYRNNVTVTSVAGASNYVRLSQRIEQVRSTSGKKLTLSFWVSTSDAATRALSVEFRQHFGTGGSPTTDVTGIGVQKVVFSGAALVKKTVTVDIPSTSAATLGTDNNDYLEVIFWLDAGSDFNSRTDSLGQASFVTRITEIQVEEGAYATPFEERPVSIEEILCNRYYEIVPVTYSAYAITGGEVRVTSGFKTQKRATPTMSQKQNNWGITESNVTASTSTYEKDARGFTVSRTATANGMTHFGELVAAECEL